MEQAAKMSQRAMALENRIVRVKHKLEMTKVKICAKTRQNLDNLLTNAQKYSILHRTYGQSARNCFFMNAYSLK